MQEDLNYYIYHFSHLHTAKYKGKAAPHKAVLLLAVMKLIELDIVRSCKIELSDELVDKFNEIWLLYKGATSIFTPDIGKPFFHMQHEPFWRLVEEDDVNSSLAKSLGLPEVPKNLPAKSKYSVKSLRETFCYAEIDESLFSLMKDSEKREELKETLIKNYLCIKDPDSGEITVLGQVA